MTARYFKYVGTPVLTRGDYGVGPEPQRQVFEHRILKRPNRLASHPASGLKPVSRNGRRFTSVYWQNPCYPGAIAQRTPQDPHRMLGRYAGQSNQLAHNVKKLDVTAGSIPAMCIVF